ncbi:hypothetical protein ACIHFC_35275 [Streptomyces sp. NPDC052013]|uniref:hypothetical protein n=1 Tax=Streptomyces sp. NPDC052013 TaxID=3365679 RepID=UPI0037CFC792
MSTKRKFAGFAATAIVTGALLASQAGAAHAALEPRDFVLNPTTTSVNVFEPGVVKHFSATSATNSTEFVDTQVVKFNRPDLVRPWKINRCVDGVRLKATLTPLFSSSTNNQMKILSTYQVFKAPKCSTLDDGTAGQSSGQTNVITQRGVANKIELPPIKAADGFFAGLSFTVLS